MESDSNLESSIRNLKKNEELEVKYTKKKRSKTPPYLIIGNGKSTRNFTEDVVVDAFELVGQLSSNQLEIFLYFKDLVVERNLDYFNRKAIDETPNYIRIPSSRQDEEALNIKKLIRSNNNGKRLEEINIVRKIKANQYMVNPYLLIPNDNFDKARINWEKLLPS